VFNDGETLLQLNLLGTAILNYWTQFDLVSALRRKDSEVPALLGIVERINLNLFIRWFCIHPALKGGAKHIIKIVYS
jgi:hypothetical protein